MYFRKEGVISTIRLRQETEREVEDAFLNVEGYVKHHMHTPLDGRTETVMPIADQIQISRVVMRDSIIIYVWYQNKKVFIYYYKKPLKDDSLVVVRIFKPGEWQQRLKKLLVTESGD